MTAGHTPVVIDTNILFSALLRVKSAFLNQIFESPRDFFICESTLTELFRHKEKLVRLSGMNPADVVHAYDLLLRRVDLYKETRIPSHLRMQARELCAGLDPDDAPQVALTLAVDGLLWTGDKTLKAGLMAKGFNRFFSY